MDCKHIKAVQFVSFMFEGKKVKVCQECYTKDYYQNLDNRVKVEAIPEKLPVIKKVKHADYPTELIVLGE